MKNDIQSWVSVQHYSGRAKRNRDFPQAEELGKDVRPHVQLAQKEVCRDQAHLEQLFQDVVSRGGEGIILRDPTALYKPGRSAGFLKRKVALTRALLQRRCANQMVQHQRPRETEARIIGPVDTSRWQCELCVHAVMSDITTNT